MRLKRWLLGLLLVLLAVLAGLFALGTAPVLRSFGNLAGLEGLEGAIWTGLRVTQLQGQQPGLSWQARGVELDPLRWRNGALQSHLRIRELRVQISGSNQPPLTPEALLRQLRLPVALRFVGVEVGSLQVNGQTVQELKFELQVGGSEPLLALHEVKARWQGAQWTGSAQLGSQGALTVQLQGQREALRLQVQGTGSLTQLPLQLLLHEGDAERLKGQLDVAPLAAQPLLAMQASFQGLNPQALQAQAPLGDWQGQLQLRPAEGANLQLKIDAQNLAAKRLDENGWPLRSLSLALQFDPAQWQQLRIDQLELALGTQQRAAGNLQVQPMAALPQAGKSLQTSLLLRGVQLQGLNRAWPALQLGGSLSLSQAKAALDAPLNWRTSLQTEGPGEAWRLQAEGSLQGQKLRLDSGELRQGPARVQLQGEAERKPDGWRTEGQAKVEQFTLLLAPWREPSRLHGDLAWTLQQRAGVHTGELNLQMLDGSQLAGLALTGSARWQASAEAAAWQLDLLAGGRSQLQASGRQGGALRELGLLARASSWQPEQLEWQLPDLAQLRPLWQPWLRQLEGSSQGSLRAGASWQGKAQAQNLRLQQVGQSAISLKQLQAELKDGQGQALLDGLQFGPWQVQNLRASGGRDGPWQMRAEGALQRAEGAQTFLVQAQSQAPIADGALWRLPALQLQLGPAAGSPAAWLAFSGAEAEARAGDPWQPALLSLQLRTPQLLRLLGEPLQLEAAQWRAGGTWQLALQGSPRLAAWLAQLEPRGSWKGSAQARISLQASQAAGAAPAIRLQASELQGDLQLDGQALGLGSLNLLAEQQASGAAQLALQISSSLLGELDARLTQTAQTALSGSVRAQLPQLKTLRAWLPGGLQLDGSARLDALLGGSRQAPRLRGKAELQVARVQHPASGLGGQQGVLKAQFNEDRLDITELSLQGQGEAGGSLSGSGELLWAEALQAKLQLKADKLRLLNRFDRRLVLSGQASLGLSAALLRLQGELTADEGVFEIGRSDAPELDDDVSVVRPEDPPATAAGSARKGPRREVDLKLDLGQRLRVQGRGFASRLTGQLQVKESGGKPAQWLGQIETQGGRYKAYGQVLDLESGEVRFTGSLENPRLNLLAIKPDIEHRVGVSVTGSAQQPRVRLYAEPDLPDNDKLAWLLLGRDPREVTGRDTALLQRAALALLSGEGENPASQLMDRLGITELSVGQGEDASTVLRLGAQLSQRWSVGYERSLNATSGSWQLVYRLGQRFRLRAQSGTDSAVDLLWLWRFD